MRMSRPDELASLIRGLSDSDSGKRERAAAEIFRLGTSLARAAVSNWLDDSELMQLLILGASNFPETTVGLAVNREHFRSIRAANGSPRLAAVPPDQDAEEIELHFAQGARLDVLTTRDPLASGAIARYLAKFGEGIQQIELLTRSVDQATKILRERLALEPIYPHTRAGADGTRVNFFLASTAEGARVLIELVESASGTAPA
jgi:hypothetical protein